MCDVTGAYNIYYFSNINADNGISNIEGCEQYFWRYFVVTPSIASGLYTVLSLISFGVFNFLCILFFHWYYERKKRKAFRVLQN